MIVYFIIGVVSSIALIIISKLVLYPILSRNEDYYKEEEFSDH